MRKSAIETKPQSEQDTGTQEGGPVVKPHTKVVCGATYQKKVQGGGGVTRALMISDHFENGRVVGTLAVHGFKPVYVQEGTQEMDKWELVRDARVPHLRSGE